MTETKFKKTYQDIKDSKNDSKNDSKDGSNDIISQMTANRIAYRHPNDNFMHCAMICIKERNCLKEGCLWG